MARLGCTALAAAVVLSGAGAVPEGSPSIQTSLGEARGSLAAAGVERYGGIPYALPPLGARRFARAAVADAPWPGGALDASRLGAPCIQNPLGDPRSQDSDSPPPSEDCLRLNIWRPAGASDARQPLRPVLVYLFGGGLCGGFAGNEYFNGSNLVLQHGVLVVTVQYRLGALGFLVGDDPARPGTGGMNGIHDNIVALQWLQRHVASFGGDPGNVTLFGQSSGGYSICTLCVAPAAKGLFRRASLLSGPCFGGPPTRGWGPMGVEKGRNVTGQVLAAHSARSLADLRGVPAEQVQWPDEWMSDASKAPYFSGYFADPGVLPLPAEELWRRGEINPEEIMVSFTSKDGTAAFYATAPTLGLVAPDTNSSTPEGYASKMQAAWGRYAERVMRQYPLAAYPTAPAAFIQADADAYVICPSRRLVRHAVRAGRRAWVSEFAHFQPSMRPPRGCSGYAPGVCAGFGCDNGVELDVVPGRHSVETRLWASHGSEYHYIFGTEHGPDGLGPPNNVTHCSFSRPEEELSRRMMAYWASFARHGDPNAERAPGAAPWPRAQLKAEGIVHVERMRFSVAETDGVPTGLVSGIHEADCDFWDSLFSGDERTLWV